MTKLPIPGVTGVKPVPTFNLGQIMSRMGLSGGSPGFGGGAMGGQHFGKLPFKNPGASIKNWADFKNMHFGKSSMRKMKGPKF